MRRPVGASMLAMFVVLASSCGESPAEPGDTAEEISLVVVSGSGQTGAVGAELPQPLVVRVTKVIRGVTVGVPLQLVNFRVVSGGGSVFAGSAITDLQGMARDYWTLGPETGENVLEVRSVNPSTGEKQVHARFEAIGVVPGPEVCNGLDDNLDGTTDNPSWRFCTAGVPAPNTDGMNTCAAGYFDLNGGAADGCERLIAGRWTLTPALSLSCPGLDSPGLVLFNNVSVSYFDITAVSPTQLRASTTLDAGLFEFPVSNLITLTVVPAVESFSGSGSFAFNRPDLIGDPRGIVQASLSAAFTGPASFEATVVISLDITVTDPLTLTDEEGDCIDVNTTVTGTRTGS